MQPGGQVGRCQDAFLPARDGAGVRPHPGQKSPKEVLVIIEHSVARGKCSRMRMQKCLGAKLTQPLSLQILIIWEGAHLPTCKDPTNGFSLIDVWREISS